MLFKRVSEITANDQIHILHWFYFNLCAPASTNGGLVTELQTSVNTTPLIQRAFWRCWCCQNGWGCVMLTCSVALFSAVRARLEDSGLSEVPEREEGLLVGTGDADWCWSKLVDTAECAQQVVRDEEERADMSGWGRYGSLGAGQPVGLWLRGFKLSLNWHCFYPTYAR